MIEHARAGGMCGRTSLDFAQVMFGWWRQTSPKVWQSRKGAQKIYMGFGFPSRLVVSVSRSRRRTVEKVRLWQLVSEPHFVCLSQTRQRTRGPNEDFASASRVPDWAGQLWVRIKNCFMGQKLESLRRSLTRQWSTNQVYLPKAWEFKWADSEPEGLPGRWLRKSHSY